MAAISRHIAEEALALIDVDYEVLPVVLDGREAMQADAPLVHERLMPLANPHLRPGGLRDENDQLKREIRRLGEERKQMLNQIDAILKDIAKLDLGPTSS